MDRPPWHPLTHYWPTAECSKATSTPRYGLALYTRRDINIGKELLPAGGNQTFHQFDQQRFLSGDQLVANCDVLGRGGTGELSGLLTRVMRGHWGSPTGNHGHRELSGLLTRVMRGLRKLSRGGTGELSGLLIGFPSNQK